MGLFSRLFDSSSDGETVRVRQDRENMARQRGDKFEHTSEGGHAHRSYDIDTSSGEYKEYGGGEKSSDRSYNK